MGCPGQYPVQFRPPLVDSNDVLDSSHGHMVFLVQYWLPGPITIMLVTTAGCPTHTDDLSTQFQ